MAAPTAFQALLYCLNETNGQQVTLDDIQISAPTVSEYAGYNTQVTITAAENGPYRNSEPRDYYYNRLELSTVAPEHNVMFANATGNTVADVVGQINAEFNLGIAEDDIANWSDELPELTYAPTEVVIDTTADSYAWIGDLTVNVHLQTLDLADVLPITELNGLTLEQLQDPDA